MALFRKPNVDKLVSEGDIEGLVKALGYEKDSPVHLSARSELEKFGDQAVDHLINALNDKEKFMRWQAALCLGRIGDQRAVEPLIAALEDEDSVVRKCAAGVLGNLGDQRAVKPLITALENNKKIGGFDVHYEVTEALKKLGVKPKRE